MKTKSTRHRNPVLPKTLLLGTLMAAGPLVAVRAGNAAPPEPSAGYDFFSRNLTLEIDSDGNAKVNGKALAPGVLYQRGVAAETEMVPWLGVATEPIDAALAAQLGLEKDTGITVITVVPESPAAEAGIEDFDVLVAFDGVALDSPQTLRELVRGKANGDVVKIALIRKGERKEVEAKLAEKSGAVASATEDVPEEGAGNDPPSPGPRGIDPFGDDFLNDSFFKGFGGFGSPGGLGSLRELEEEMARIRKQMESRFEDMMGADPLGGAKGSASNFMHMENSTMAISDETGSITVTRRDGKTHVEARDPEGKVIYDGPADSEEERAKMPADIREKVENFENSPMNFGAFDQFRTAPGADSPEVPLQPEAKRKSETEPKEAEPKAEAEEN